LVRIKFLLRDGEIHFLRQTGLCKAGRELDSIFILILIFVVIIAIAIIKLFQNILFPLLRIFEEIVWLLGPCQFQCFNVFFPLGV